MSRTVEESVERYEWKLRSGRAARSKYRTVEEQVERFREAQVHLAEVRLVAREVMDECGVLPIWRVYYVAFTYAADRVVRRYEGTTCLNELKGLVDRWDCRGLDRAVLERILERAFRCTLSD